MTGKELFCRAAVIFLLRLAIYCTWFIAIPTAEDILGLSEKVHFCTRSPTVLWRKVRKKGKISEQEFAQNNKYMFAIELVLKCVRDHRVRRNHWQLIMKTSLLSRNRLVVLSTVSSKHDRQ